MHPFISSPIQTALAAVVSMGLAQALHLPDPYWAPISAIVCSLDAFEGAAATARRRLVGTLIGVFLAALQVSFTAYNLINYGLAIALLGLLCRAARLHPGSRCTWCHDMSTLLLACFTRRNTSIMRSDGIT